MNNYPGFSMRVKSFYYEGGPKIVELCGPKAPITKGHKKSLAESNYLILFKKGGINAKR